MDSKILNYSTWKKKANSARLNEGLFWDVTETEPIKGTTHKVKVKYLDSNSFKVKAVNDVDMVTAAGDITPGLIDGMIDFLKSHDRTNFEREYPALANPISFWKDHFFTYNVLRENDRRQVVVFTIQKRANFKGVAPETKILSDAAAAALSQSPEANALLAKSGQSIIQKTPDETAQTSKTSPGAFKEIQLADLKNLTKNSPFFKTFDDAVAVLAKSGLFADDTRATGLIAAVIAELKKGQLGKNSELLIKGLMAGLGMSTYVDKYGQTESRTSITQEVYDKLVAMLPTAQNSSRQYYLGLDGRAILEAEELTSPLAGFDMDAFIRAISQEAAPIITDVIKRSEVAGKKDPRVIAFQQLVIDRFKKHAIGTTDLYKKFASYTADGDYGPTTDAMVAFLKAGLKTSDKDVATRGDNITPELIQKINDEKVSESVYLDLNSRLVEQFDMAAAQASMKTYKPAGGGGASGGGGGTGAIPDVFSCLKDTGGTLADNGKKKAMKYTLKYSDGDVNFYLYDNYYVAKSEATFNNNLSSKNPKSSNDKYWKWTCDNAKDLLKATNDAEVRKALGVSSSTDGFSGVLDEAKRKELAKTIREAIKDAGFETYLDGDVLPTDEGVIWKYKYKNDQNGISTYKISTDGTYLGTIKYKGKWRNADFNINGKLTEDLTSISITFRGKTIRTVPLAKAVRTEVSVRDMTKASDIDHTEIGANLFNAMNGGGTYENDVYNALRKMNTYQDWRMVDAALQKVDDEASETLRSWLSSELNNNYMGDYVIDALAKANLIPTFIYDDYGNDFYGMYGEAYEWAKSACGEAISSMGRKPYNFKGHGY